MQRQEKPPLRIKLLYSTGDLSVSIPLAILMFFQLYFITDVAHLRPDLVGWAVGIGKMWDAVLLILSVVFAWFYPITREVHASLQEQLATRSGE